MVFALDAFSSTFGLVVIFFVLLPLIAQGLIAFAAAQAIGERAQNQEYAGRLSNAPDDEIV